MLVELERADIRPLADKLIAWDAQNSFAIPDERVCALIDTGPAAGVVIGVVEIWGTADNGGRIDIAGFEIGAVVPEQTMRHNGSAIDVLERGLLGADDEIVECDDVVASGHAVLVGDQCVVEEIDAVFQAGGCKVFFVGAAVDHTDGCSGIAVDGVVFEEEHSFHQQTVVDELDAILSVGGDLVAAHTIDQWLCGFAESNLNAVVAVVADDVVFYGDVELPVQIDAFFAVVFDAVESAGATAAGLVIDAIAALRDVIVPNVDNGAGDDAVAGVADGEADDFGAAGGCVDDDGWAAVAIDDGLLDEGAVVAGEELRCQDDVLADAHFADILTGCDQNGVFIDAFVERFLQGDKISRHVQDTGIVRRIGFLVFIGSHIRRDPGVLILWNLQNSSALPNKKIRGLVHPGTGSAITKIVVEVRRIMKSGF